MPQKGFVAPATVTDFVNDAVIGQKICNPLGVSKKPCLDFVTRSSQIRVDMLLARFLVIQGFLLHARHTVVFQQTLRSRFLSTKVPCL